MTFSKVVGTGVNVVWAPLKAKDKNEFAAPSTEEVKVQVNVFKLLAPSKTAVPIVVTDEGITTSLTIGKSLKKSLGMVVAPSETMTVSKDKGTLTAEL